MKQAETLPETIIPRLCFDIHFSFNDKDLEGQQYSGLDLFF